MSSRIEWSPSSQPQRRTSGAVGYHNHSSPWTLNHVHDVSQVQNLSSTKDLFSKEYPVAENNLQTCLGLARSIKCRRVTIAMACECEWYMGVQHTVPGKETDLWIKNINVFLQRQNVCIWYQRLHTFMQFLYIVHIWFWNDPSLCSEHTPQKLGSGRKSQLSADFCVHAKVVLKSKLYGTDVM